MGLVFIEGRVEACLGCFGSGIFCDPSAEGWVLPDILAIPGILAITVVLWLKSLWREDVCQADRQLTYDAQKFLGVDGFLL
ncbi:MAG: hypothetical protein Fur0046_02300 [Cyanobacteria bacterium J069]|nr:MAG: hypothetical protein D6742_15290 [Cyanobacteria bacterium J069]